MSNKPLNERTALEVATLIAQGGATSEQVVRACLDRIAVRDSQVKAWQFLDPELVLAQARARDVQSGSGAIRGVPFGIKDIIDTFDMPTEYGSPIYKGNQTRNDAACVAMGRAAGGVPMGKTVTTEFANRHPGKTCHPIDPARTPGGSSSGSAAAVADCQVHLAIGTQTTASTLRPASFCGVYGYRPTYGVLSCSGVRASSTSVDTVGLYGRSVEDIALYRDALLGRPVEPLAGELCAAPRIGFVRTPFWPQVEAPTAALIEDGVRRLSAAGARVSEVGLPREFDGLEQAHRSITSYEFVRNFRHEITYHWDKISLTCRNGRIKDGLACTFEQYAAGQAHAAKCRELLRVLFEGHDVLVAPIASGEAPIGLNSTGNASFCIIWTTTLVPAMSVPAFVGPNGLPIGLQIIAAPHADRQLFEAARWVMRHLG